MEQTLAFVTLFLGLVTGSQEIELLVGEGVVAVELRLDGELCDRLEAPPWVAECDFGATLEPHHLEAVAWDASSLEVARTDQWLNLPRPSAEAKLIVEPGRAGVPGLVRLTWQSLTSVSPQRISVELDGSELDVRDPSAIPLPPLDMDQLHFLRAELDFAENVSAVAEATFGGFYAEDVATELTAVPVVLERGRLGDPVEMQGWFRHLGIESRVAATEKGVADVVVVRSASAASALAQMLSREAESRSYRRSASSRSTRFVHALSGDMRIQFIWPHPERRQQRDQVYELFPRSQELGPDDGGWLWLLGRTRQPSYAPERERLCDAVAVAGLNAGRRDRRRVVVAILGEGTEDASQMPPEMVRGYLSSIRVPLFVWTFGESADANEWGEVEQIRNRADLGRAIRRVSKAVGQQRIVWLDGRLLPQHVQLTEQASGVRLVP